MCSGNRSTSIAHAIAMGHASVQPHIVGQQTLRPLFFRKIVEIEANAMHLTVQSSAVPAACGGKGQ